MTIQGSCLCGSVVFEVDEVTGPFEICHCNRCRKLSGSMGMPAIGVDPAGYRMIAGKELIKTYEAPILYAPPAYHSFFCSNCGSPTPPPEASPGDFFEIPAGLLDGDPGIRADKHIFTEYLPAWDKITDGLPEYDMRKLVRYRHGEELPENFVSKTHYDVKD